MATKRAHRGGGNTRKINRSLVQCRIYRERHTREKNKVRKITRHLKRHINDQQARSMLQHFINIVK